MGLLVHRAARVLKGDGTHSEAQIVQVSILVGCVQSVDWTRAHLYDLLDDLHRAHRPTQIHSWVYDLALRAQGLVGTTAIRVISAGGALMEGLTARGGKISQKLSFWLPPKESSKKSKKVLPTGASKSSGRRQPGISGETPRLEDGEEYPWPKNVS